MVLNQQVMLHMHTTDRMDDLARTHPSPPSHTDIHTHNKEGLSKEGKSLPAIL